MTSLIQKLEWSGFVLLEYLLSNRNFHENFKVLDIGGGWGSHTAVMRSFGLSVDIVDKYNGSSEFSYDFMEHNFNSKYDMIMCSHVLEHQRNPGIFLDKIYDLLTDDGHLIISGPKIDKGMKYEDSPVELVDLYRTITDFLNIDTPNFVQGHSLKPILTGNKKTVRNSALTELRAVSYTHLTLPTNREV